MTKHCKTLFISDVHLGSSACRDDLLLQFLKEYDAENIYLVGDIIDFWRINQNPNWPQTHNDVIQKLLRKGRKGTNIIYIPGNHDEYIRYFIDRKFGSITVKYDDYYFSNGKVYYITHGDQFDKLMKKRNLSLFGCRMYNMMLKFNSYFIKKIKRSIKNNKKFESAIIEHANRIKVDGVICGHMHTPKIEKINGIMYYNCGDWTENYTALIENLDGSIELIKGNKKC